MKIGEVIEGQISGIKPYGIFIKFNNVFGFCHISNLSKSFISDISATFKINQTVKAKIIQIDENNRINLSIKDAESDIMQETSESIQNKSNINYKVNNHQPKKQSFEDMLNQFLKTSDDKLKSINNRAKKHTKR